MSFDPALGKKIHEHLLLTGVENPISRAVDPISPFTQENQSEIERSMYDVISTLGLNLTDDSIQDTPRRIAKMYCQEIFSGLDYNTFPSCSTFDSHGMDQLVSIVDIEVRSMCEHHFLPFLGTCTIAYIPSKVVLGISKFNRIVDFFARRPQLQERLTAQICYAIGAILLTDDVAVYIKAEHLCTKMRGIKDFKSKTVTSMLHGRFRSVGELRNEFIALTR